MRMNFPVICMVAVFFSGGVTMASQADSPNSGSWSGVIMNNNCTADEAFAEAPKCTEKDVPGAKLILYDDTTRQMYLLDPQDEAIGHLGDSMTLTGTLEGNTVHVVSLKMATLRLAWNVVRRPLRSPALATSLARSKPWRH